MEGYDMEVLALLLGVDVLHLIVGRRSMCCFMPGPLGELLLTNDSTRGVRRLGLISVGLCCFWALWQADLARKVCMCCRCSRLQGRAAISRHCLRGSCGGHSRVLVGFWGCGLPVALSRSGAFRGPCNCWLKGWADVTYATGSLFQQGI